MRTAPPRSRESRESGLFPLLRSGYNSPIRNASITEAKNRLSALLDEVRAGETIVIVDRGIPVARLEPASAIASDDDGRLARLDRAGFVILPGTAQAIHDHLLAQAPPRASADASVLEALLDERRTSR